MNKIIKYFQEVGRELKKVEWPDRQQTINKTALVIVISALVAAYLGGLDLVFQKIMASIL